MTGPDRPSGVWKLYGFEPKLERWKSEQHPPAHIYHHVQTWWPSLAHAPRAMGRAVPGQPGVRFAWVPNCYLPDHGDGPRGVQCHYKVFDAGRQVVCQFFTVATLTFPRETGRFDD